MSYGLGKVGQREGSRTRNVGRKKQRSYSYDDDNEHEYVVGLEEDIQKLVGILMGDEGKSQVTNAISIVGMEWDTKHILSEILRNVVDGWSSKDKALSVEGLVDELRNFLKDRSYLIVLDDVWHRGSLDERSLAIPYGGSNESYESLGKEMLQKCDGLPLAIRALAGILSGKQNNIGQWQMPCFLYLSAFPEDCEIPAGMLIRMWIAEGLAPANGDLCPEDVAMQYLEELNQRFLIQVASFNYKGLIKAVRLHDAARTQY
ncbi:putative disease resistance RPP13-like protein 2 [Silene latifolia]|uniref:putative disease resistance RPP13-like protein 2 n=1 Tax=Silene latifolia TaxID=37657 RepID=UPI003D76DE6D